MSWAADGKPQMNANAEKPEPDELGVTSGVSGDG